MLKKRIIPIELLYSGRLVKSVKFTSFRDVGDPVKSSKVYSDQDADELMVLNISRVDRKIDSILKVVNDIAQNCFVPLTVGGGINSVEDAIKLFEAGADKVLVNSAALKNASILSEISRLFGNQAVVVGIDVKLDSDGEFHIYSDCGRYLEPLKLNEYIGLVTKAGVGEVFIQSIDNDGVMNGYDFNLLKYVKKTTDVPIIAGGGAGHFSHILKAFECGIDAAACGSLFNFGDNNPLRAKAFLKNYSIPLKNL